MTSAVANAPQSDKGAPSNSYNCAGPEQLGANPRMTERALELLLLPDRPCLLLDVGCGSGISFLDAVSFLPPDSNQ